MYLGHYPAGASTQTFIHYSQLVLSKKVVFLFAKVKFKRKLTFENKLQINVFYAKLLAFELKFTACFSFKCTTMAPTRQMNKITANRHRHCTT